MKGSSIVACSVLVMLLGCSADPQGLGPQRRTTGEDSASALDTPGEPPLGETADDGAPNEGFAVPGAAATPATPPQAVGCNELQFGISDFGPFAPGSQLPYRGESDAEVNVFRSGYLHATLDYGALRRYADPSYCSPYEINCRPTSNTQRFRTLRVTAGLGTARVVRIALWSTLRTQLAYRQVSMSTPGGAAGARDVPVGGAGPFTFELRNLLTAAVLTSIATDDRNDYMLTAYIPDASQRDVYRNSVCALRVNVTGKSFGN